MQEMENGTYAGKFTGECSVYENAKGSLVAAFGVEIDQGPVRTWFATLVSPDGAVATRRVEDLKAMLGWDGADPSWLVDSAAQYAGAPCEVVIENEQGQDGKTYSNIRWVNVPGAGGGGASLPQPMDKRTLLAKYGQKFRAIAGGVPARPTAPKPAPAKAPTQAPQAAPPPAPPSGLPFDQPPPGPPPMAPTAATSNMNECWALLLEIMGESPRPEIEATWFACCKEVNEKNPADYTAEEWGTLRARIQEMRF